MNELDRQITSELNRVAQAAPKQPGSAGAEVKQIMELVTQQNERHLRIARIFVWGWHVFFLVVLIIGVIFMGVFDSHADSDMPVGLFISMGAFVGLAVVKLFYWLVQIRVRLEKKLMEVEVGLAELKEMVREAKR